MQNTSETTNRFAAWALKNKGGPVSSVAYTGCSENNIISFSFNIVTIAGIILFK